MTLTTTTNIGSGGRRHHYQTAQIKVREANLKIRIFANWHDLAAKPGIIIGQTPQGGERVDCGTVIGVKSSAEDRRR